jgi:hypothetical protein
VFDSLTPRSAARPTPCKDPADSLAGKDRYEFEKFFAPRTVLTLSESIGRFIDTRRRIPVSGSRSTTRRGRGGCQTLAVYDINEWRW